jgi:hypothetical protein
MRLDATPQRLVGDDLFIIGFIAVTPLRHLHQQLIHTQFTPACAAADLLSA